MRELNLAQPFTNLDKAMIVFQRARGHSVVIDNRIFITVSDFRERDICLQMSVPYDIMVRGVPRLFGHSGRSDDGEQLAFVEVAPCPVTVHQSQLLASIADRTVSR